MSITDELREFAPHLDLGKVALAGWKEALLAIADRIDAEHERVVRERRRSCVYYDPERHYCSCHDFDVSGYVELPKDADGEAIHVGDVLTDGEYTFRVDELAAFGDGSWSIRNEDGNAWAACDVTHYHAPTVEDVLREFGRGWHERMVGPETFDIADYVERYAAKLRLAGDAE